VQVGAVPGQGHAQPAGRGVVLSDLASAGEGVDRDHRVPLGPLDLVDRADQDPRPVGQAGGGGGGLVDVGGDDGDVAFGQGPVRDTVGVQATAIEQLPDQGRGGGGRCPRRSRVPAITGAATGVDSVASCAFRPFTPGVAKAAPRLAWPSVALIVSSRSR
jgi:hypothetical protein